MEDERPIADLESPPGSTREELLRWKDLEASAVAPSGLDADLLACNWEWEGSQESVEGDAGKRAEEWISLRPGGALGGTGFFTRWKSNTPAENAGKKADSHRELPMGTGLQTSESKPSSKRTLGAEKGDKWTSTPQRAPTWEGKAREPPSDEGMRSNVQPKSPLRRQPDSKKHVENRIDESWNEKKTHRTQAGSTKYQGKGALSSETYKDSATRRSKTKDPGWDDVEGGVDLRSISNEIERERLLHRKTHQEKKASESEVTGDSGPQKEGSLEDSSASFLSPPPQQRHQAQASREPNLFSAYEQFFTTSSPMMRFSDKAQESEQPTLSAWPQTGNQLKDLAGMYPDNNDSTSCARTDRPTRTAPDAQARRFTSFDAFVGATDSGGKSMPGLPKQAKTLEEVEQSMAASGTGPTMNQRPPPPAAGVPSDPSAELKSLLKIPGAAGSMQGPPPGMYPPGGFGPPPPYPMPVPAQVGYMPMPQYPPYPVGQLPQGRGRVLTAEELERGMGQ